MSVRLTRWCLLLIALAVASVDGKVHKREKGQKGPREVTIKNGDTLDLTGGKYDEGEKKKEQYSIEVQKMFDAISTNEPDKINKVLDRDRVHIDTRGPSGCMRYLCLDSEPPFAPSLVDPGHLGHLSLCVWLMQSAGRHLSADTPLFESVLKHHVHSVELLVIWKKANPTPYMRAGSQMLAPV